MASVDFMPRTGTDFRLGDAFEVDIAQLEWLVGRERRTSIFIGKFDSVLGIEYPVRKANQPLRHHAVADRALHDGHAHRHQGSQPPRPRRHGDPGGRGDQRDVGHRAVSLLRRDRQQRRARRSAAASRSRRRCPGRCAWSSAFRACTARRIARSTASTRSGSRAPTCRCWRRASSSRPSFCAAAPTARSARRSISRIASTVCA